MNQVLRRMAQRAAQVAAALVLLAGCVEGGGGADAPSRISTVGGVTIVGPSGYCIDTKASRAGARGSFTLLGSCASISQRAGASRPAAPAVLTASVVSAGANPAPFVVTFPEMARFFASAKGRAALSRSGRAASVQVVKIGTADEVMYLDVSDTSPSPGQAADAVYSRAIMMVRGQIVTLSVLGLRAKPLPAGQKRAILETFVARVRAANRN